MLRWVALVLCLHSLVAFKQSTFVEEEDVERSSVSYWYQRFYLAANQNIVISSNLWQEWFSQPRYTNWDNRVVYQVTAPAGYIVQASCTFRLKCDYFEYYFSPSGVFPASNIMKLPCTSTGSQSSNVILKSTTNLFHARYRFGKYAYSHDSAITGFRCLLKAVSTTVTTAPTTAPTTTPTTKTPTQSCDCGKVNLEEDRIVNGTETSPNKYPFFAALSYNNGGRQIFCGASLISSRWVMTAAHCVDFIKPAMLNDYQVILGSHNLNNPSAFERTVDIEQIILHEDWDSQNVRNDIALIKLRSPIQSTSKISPVCLPFNNIAANIVDENALTMGYGSIKYNGQRTTTLHEVYLKVKSTDSCRETYEDYITQVTDKMICTYENQKDACKGDSGGPLTVSRNNKLQQVGVVSWGDECAKKDRPGVYTDVSKYLGWIQAKTNDAICED